MQVELDYPPDDVGIPEEESVAIRKEDWPAINQAIADAIEPLRPHGWRRAIFLLRQLGAIAAIIAIFVAVVVFAATQFNLANSRLAKQATFETNTERDLGEIRKDIAAIRGDLAKQSMINHATLPLADFKATLPDLSSAIASAKQHNVKTPPNVIGDLQQKLSASVDAPDFWPTAAHFISYRSQVNVADFQNLLRPDMRNCTDKPPTPMEAQISAEDEKNVPVAGAITEGSKVIPALYENCRFVLDSPEEAARIPFAEEGRAFYLKFKNCQIIYNGGPIAVFSPKPKFNAINGKGPTRTDVYAIQGQRLFFENCLFLFSIRTAPPPEGKVLTEQILTQNGNTLTVNLWQV